MRQALALHAASTCTALTQVEAEVVRGSPGCLSLRFVVTGAMGDVVLPSVGAARCGNELWQHTCFEAFIRATTSEAYTELNFAPSTEWAAYRFDAYRSGMTAASEIKTPQIDVSVNEIRCELRAELNLLNLPDLRGEAPWSVGVSAVIEETSGCKSYWALAHPPGQPDFHHADSFALQVPPARAV